MRINEVRTEFSVLEDVNANLLQEEGGGSLPVQIEDVIRSDKMRSFADSIMQEGGEKLSEKISDYYPR